MQCFLGLAVAGVAALPCEAFGIVAEVVAHLGFQGPVQDGAGIRGRSSSTPLRSCAGVLRGWDKRGDLVVRLETRSLGAGGNADFCPEGRPFKGETAGQKQQSEACVNWTRRIEGSLWSATQDGTRECGGQSGAVPATEGAMDNKAKTARENGARDFIEVEARLTIVFTALAVSRTVEKGTGLAGVTPSISGESYAQRLSPSTEQPRLSPQRRRRPASHPRRIQSPETHAQSK